MWGQVHSGRLAGRQGGREAGREAGRQGGREAGRQGGRSRQEQAGRHRHAGTPIHHTHQVQRHWLQRLHNRAAGHT